MTIYSLGGDLCIRMFSRHKLSVLWAIYHSLWHGCSFFWPKIDGRKLEDVDEQAIGLKFLGFSVSLFSSHAFNLILNSGLPFWLLLFITFCRWDFLVSTLVTNTLILSPSLVTAERKRNPGWGLSDESSASPKRHPNLPTHLYRRTLLLCYGTTRILQRLFWRHTGP